MRPVLLGLTSGLLWTFAAIGHAADPAPTPALANEAGWSWLVAPASATWSLSVSSGFALRWDELQGNKLQLTVAHGPAASKGAVRLRPVAFDADGQRFELPSHSTGGTWEVMLRAYSLDLDRLPRDRLAFLGIEKLTAEGIRDVLAPAAASNLREAGVAALPYPRLGEPYEFELATLEGTALRSSDLRGKVVLLDFWATWCGPCMAKMPRLKELHSQHANDLEIVGVNCDGSLETARRAVGQHGLPWSNVLAPEDDELREAWLTATGTSGLPRLLLVDRRGVLRGDVSADDLDKALTELLAKP